MISSIFEQNADKKERLKSMKRGYIASVLIVFIVLFSSLTNPTKSDYVEWAKEQVTQEEGALLGMVAGPVFNSITSKQNFVLFTIFETTYGESDKEKMIVLGVFNNFFHINGNK